MKANTKVIGSVVIIAIALLLLGSYLHVLPFSITGASGFLALSNGQTQFTSNDPTIGGQAWLLTVSENGQGQSAYGSFTAKDSTSGVTSNQFSITTSLDKNYALYNILNQGNFIQRIYYTTTSASPANLFGALDDCNSAVYSNSYKPSNSFTRYCWYYTNDATYGTVSSANINFQSTITVSGSGGSDSCTISNAGSNSCVANDGKVAVSWAGSLVSGQAPPQPADQNIIALYKTSQGGWITADSGTYNSWSSSRQNILNCLSTAQGTSCFTNLNNLESTLLGGKPFVTSGGDTATTSGTQSNGKIQINLPTQIQFPVLVMRVKADLLGVNIPVGKPKITSESSSLFQTGQSGIVQVTVQNVGTGAGSFGVSLGSCSNGFQQSGNSITISSLAPSNSQTVYIPITSNVVSGTTSGSCQINVIDLNNPNNRDSASVSVSSSAIALCNPNEQRISGNNIEVCQSNQWKLLTSCNSTQVAQYVGTTPKCADLSQASTGLPNVGGFFSSIASWFSNLFGGIYDTFVIIKWIVIIAATILVGLVVDNFLEFSISLRRNRKVRIGISVIAAVLVGAFLYSFIYSFFFWLLLVVAAVLFAITKYFKVF